MLIEFSGTRWAQFRHLLALLVLVFIAGFVPLLTIYHNSVQVNDFVAVGQMLFILLLIRESAESARKFFQNYNSLFFPMFVISSVALIIFSFFESGGYDRSLYYISNFVFFFSLVYFINESAKIYKTIIWVKVISVFFFSIAFLVIFLLDGESLYQSVLNEPPVYRHLRHYNYDLMMAFGAIYLLLMKKNIGLILFGALFLIFSIFSIWTGGRGQFLSLLLFIIIILFLKYYREALVGLLMLILAFVLVCMSGEATLLLGQIERTVLSKGVDGISSGRLSIWLQTWNEGLDAGWFGHGADSFRLSDIGSGRIVHAHNSVLQFYFEYGYLGLVLSIFFFVWTGLICLKVVLLDSSDKFLKCLCSLMLAIYAYGMLDGIFYHAIPFSFVIFIGAVLFVELNKDGIHGKPHTASSHHVSARPD